VFKPSPAIRRRCKAGPIRPESQPAGNRRETTPEVLGREMEFHWHFMVIAVPESRLHCGIEALGSDRQNCSVSLQPNTRGRLISVDLSWRRTAGQLRENCPYDQQTCGPTFTQNVKVGQPPLSAGSEQHQRLDIWAVKPGPDCPCIPSAEGRHPG
jgi:hypothetical protein